MNFKTPTEVPDELVGRAGCPAGLTKYDIVVVGTQESGPLQVCCCKPLLQDLLQDRLRNCRKTDCRPFNSAMADM